MVTLGSYSCLHVHLRHSSSFQKEYEDRLYLVSRTAVIFHPKILFQDVKTFEDDYTVSDLVRFL